MLPSTPAEQTGQDNHPDTRREDTCTHTSTGECMHMCMPLNRPPLALPLPLPLELALHTPSPSIWSLDVSHQFVPQFHISVPHNSRPPPIHPGETPDVCYCDYMH